MARNFTAKINGQHRVTSKTKFNDAQIADLGWMFEQFGNLILDEVKSNPELLKELAANQTNGKANA